MSRLKDNSPLATLAVGLVTAAVLLGLGVNATANDAALAPTSEPATTAATARATTPATKPPASAPADRTRATYAGRVRGGGATVAVVVRDGAAIAYVCDGRRVEAWLHGTATGGALKLTGTNRSRLSGTYSAAGAEGSIVAGGRTWAFDVPVAKRPTGLYRAAADVRRAKVVGGWIVLSDGTQVGVVTLDDKPVPAPELDVDSGRATVDGEAVTAAPVDGSTIF